MKSFTYKAFGLHVRSDLELPELLSVPARIDPDVRIRRLDIEIKDKPPLPSGRDIRVTSDGVVLSWNEVGRFLVRDGNEILVEPRCDISEDVVRLPLLGIVFGALLHQRGIFTLHASAVSINDSVVAFVGAKGAGKSTLLAALHKRDHRIITDDILALTVADDPVSPIAAEPGYPHIKLWPSSSEVLGSDSDSLHSIHPNLEKQGYRPSEGFQMDALPLDRIYILAVGENVSSVRLSQKDAFVELLKHSYAARFLGDSGAGSVHFRQCSKIVKQTPLFRLERPFDLSLMEEVAKLIENET